MNKLLFLFGLICFAGSVLFGASNTSQIGYLYPAGGQKGTVVRVTAGGQFLRGAEKAHVTGDGVQVKVVKHYRPIGNLNKERRDLLDAKLMEVLDKRIAELPPGIREKISAKRKPKNQAGNAGAKKKVEDIKKSPDTKKVSDAKSDDEKKKPGDSGGKDEKEKQLKGFQFQMPEHPLLEDIENKSIRELEHIRRMIYQPRNRLQQNRQLAEMVLLEITIDKDAKPGKREIRIQTNNGLTNPVIFEVGSFAETYELEPNDRKAFMPIRQMEELPDPKAITLPAVLNGQILPGDVDRFRFFAQKGQKLVIETHARSLIPYLADAVPGWFQSTITLYRAGYDKELAFADDYRFNPDPVLFYAIDVPGDYELEIRDSLYRGREDFVYRIIIGDQPFITEMFPLGGKAGSETIAEVDGWNITDKKLKLDTASGKAIRHAAVEERGYVSNTMAYTVSDYDEYTETGRNNDISDAQKVNIPIIINGRIEKPGDKDVFWFDGKEGDEIVAEVLARRLNSPLDSFLELTDSGGNRISWNDDYVLKEEHLHKDLTGLVTHHADSYLLAKLPKTGKYYIHISDSQRHGGKAYGYRLRVCKRAGDFSLRVTPSSLYIPAGSIAPLRVHILRLDGFEGAIDLSLKDAPEGFGISGGRIPAGCDMIDITLKAPAKFEGDFVSLNFEGKAEIGGQIVTHPAQPAEDLMQAFLYRHLVPSEEFVAAVGKKRWQLPDVKITGGETVHLQAGDSARVVLEAVAKWARIHNEVKLELLEAPEGFSISDIKVNGRQISFLLKAEKDAVANGFKGNLILEAYRMITPKNKKGQPLKIKRKTSMGILPAIPVSVAKKI